MVAIASIYLIANLAHPNDTEFAKSKLSKFLIWLGFTISLMPILIVHLDVQDYKTHSNLGLFEITTIKLLWMVIIIA
jgi:hypothetical protein